MPHGNGSTLTISEAAASLGVSPSFVRAKLVRSGRLKSTGGGKGYPMCVDAVAVDWRKEFRGECERRVRRARPISRPRTPRAATEILTTGDVARVCKVAPRTAGKWCDSGLLPSYRLPGSKDRRVHAADLDAFIARHKMGVTMPDVMRPLRALLVGLAQRAEAVRAGLASGGFEVRAVEGVFAAGVAAAEFRPQVAVLDESLGRIELAMIEAGLRAAGCDEIAVRGDGDGGAIRRSSAEGVVAMVLDWFGPERHRAGRDAVRELEAIS